MSKEFIIENWATRLVSEDEELGKKITQLRKYTDTSAFGELGVLDKSLLTYQLKVMMEYKSVLEVRLKSVVNGNYRK